MATTSSAAAAVARSHKRRADCFFGLHFDHHAKLDDTVLNERVTAEQVQRIIELTRCDYIQHDCKGHPGIAGYPDSQAGVSPPALKADALAIYRKVTAAHGVNLYMHFSGVSDKQAVAEHPAWKAVGDDPMIEQMGATSTFGPYVRERMIPQMLEVIERYQVDGFWVDGDCWATVVDYCEMAKARFREATGQREPPTQPGEPYWLEWLTVHRDQFFAYVAQWVHAVREQAPGAGCEVCSNWLYSTHAPEPVKVAMDFASGDFSPGNAVNSARLEARYLSNAGLPWDLMAWAFVNAPQPGKAKKGGRAYKSAEQLQQEAAQVLALGGGFQCYFHPERHGQFSEAQLELMRRVAAFCHARKDVCWKSETVGQVAVLLDSTSYFSASKGVYRPWNGQYEPLHGVLHAALEAGHACDVLAEHQLNWQQDRYPVVVVPQWAQVPVSVVAELTACVERGGSLLLVGAETAARFTAPLAEAGIELTGEAEDRLAYLQVEASRSRCGEAGAVPVQGAWQGLHVTGDAAVLGLRTPGVVAELEAEPAAALGRLGEGRIAVVAGPVGDAHFRLHSPWVRDWLDDVLRRLYEPIVQVEAEAPAGSLDVVLRRKGGRTVVHLLNVTGMPTTPSERAGYPLIDRVPAVGPVRLQGRPRKVRLEPGGETARTRWDAAASTLTVDVPTVHIHVAVVME